MRYFGASIIEAGDQGYTNAGTGSQGYTDVASPPPPPPQVSTGDDWSNPYAHAPPLVQAQPASDTSWDTWFKRGTSVATGLVDIFGRPQVVPQRPQQPQGLPLVGWVAIGVAGVVVLGVAARSLRKTSYAGRRSRR